MKEIAQEFIEQSIFRLEENTPRIKKCLDLLTEEEIWQRPNNESNSVGNLMLHLCGNITQYIISALGCQPDERERGQEFAAAGGFSRAELLLKLQHTVTNAVQTIREAKEPELVKIHHVQGFQLSGIGIIIHVTEHYSYHTGQVVFWTKLLKNKNLNFYGNFNLNQKNQL